MLTRLFIIAITPGIALALSIYFTDRYDKEPFMLLIKVFILGSLSVIPTAFVENFLDSYNIFQGFLGAAYTSYIVAGMTEEFFKGLVVYKIALPNKAFDEKLDGIVYASLSALGFATIENIMYVVFRFTANPHIGLYRGVLSVPAHMLFGITMGYYLSLAKFAHTNGEYKTYVRKAIIIPALLHGTFNFILMVNLPGIFFIFIPYVIYLWIVNLRKLNEYYTDSKLWHYANVYIRRET